MADLESAEACTNTYSDIEEDFFRAGDEMSRMFEQSHRLPTEDFIPVKPAAEPEDDEWDWMLAVARARARPATQPG